MSEARAHEIWGVTEPATDDDLVIDLRDELDAPVYDTPGVAFVDLVAADGAIREEIVAAMLGVINRGDFVLGDDIERFEQEFASHCGASHAIGVDSGFSALELILRAFDLGPGDEVITPANTFHSTVRAIEACGARPVLVDCDPVSRNLDPSLLERAITKATRAILPVHLYGHPADMATITEVAEAHGLLVFEDACQAHGSRHRGARAGSLSDAAAFSFYPTKNLGAFGDAGMVVTRHARVDDRIRSLRNLGSKVKNQHDERGFNRRLDTLQAAILRVKLRRLDEANQARQRVAGWYEEALGDLDIALPQIADWAEHVFHLYVIESARRDALARDLQGRRIQTGIHYPVPIHLQPAFRSLGYTKGSFPESEALADRILSLPMHPAMTRDEVDLVAQAVRQSEDDRVHPVAVSGGGGRVAVTLPGAPPPHAG
jgi:dTDP-4-amino-4,6-dideoxygalactose transaminase